MKTNVDMLLEALRKNGVTFSLDGEFGDGDILTPIGLSDIEANKLVDRILVDSGWRYQKGIDQPMFHEFLLTRAPINPDDRRSQAMLNFDTGEIFVMEEGIQ